MDFFRETPYRVRIPRVGKMRSDGVIYASEAMIDELQKEKAAEQVVNVACLPGIVGNSIAMPDVHWGYGFPIGGVAAFDTDCGVISPGGVGYDINCGVRLLSTSILAKEIGSRIQEVTDTLFQNIPSGVGSKRKDLRLTTAQMKGVSERGAAWGIENGFGDPSDLQFVEDGGALSGASFDSVSEKAVERGYHQLGTLGSGNHFVEVQEVSEIYDESAAASFGLYLGALTVLIHTGSRGFGYQICDDYLGLMIGAAQKYGIELPDRQLCCAPVKSEEAERYLGAMRSAANFAYANRQLITHWVRESFEQVLKLGPRSHQMNVVYDVCHNIAKIEEHEVKGKKCLLCVHRKGATRAFPAGRPEVPSVYQSVGHPVLIPGDMGRYSFVMVGEKKALQETFGSCCHGAGRRLSRTAAKKAARGRSIFREMADRGIAISAAGRDTVVEEMPEAYKDVAEVVDVVVGAGLARKVAKLRPLGVIKG